MHDRFISTPQGTEKYLVNAAVLRTQVYDWYVVSDDMECIQVNGAELPNILSLLASPATLSRSENVRLLSFDSGWLRFQDLVARWHKERGVTSSVEKMAMCPAYQTIIAMGPDSAIPLILRQLASEGDNPDHWFWALRFLANDDPVSADDRGDMKRMAAAWLDWGRRNLYAVEPG